MKSNNGGTNRFSIRSFPKAHFPLTVIASCFCGKKPLRAKNPVFESNIRKLELNVHREDNKKKKKKKKKKINDTLVQRRDDYNLQLQLLAGTRSR